MDVEGIWVSFRSVQNDLGYSDRIMFAFLLSLVSFLTYYIPGWLFVFSDWYGWLEPYAIRSGKKRLPPIEMQWKAINEATLSTFVANPIIAYVVAPALLPFLSLFELPSLQKALLDWVLMSLTFSTAFYWIHYSLHEVKFLYAFHKTHHSFHESVGFTAQFDHPVETFTNAITAIVPIFIVRPHLLVWLCYFGTTMFEILDSHSGYDVPWKFLYPWSDVYPWGSGARKHDFHHSHNIGMYGGGLFGGWDILMGTDVKYKEFRNQKLRGSKRID